MPQRTFGAMGAVFNAVSNLGVAEKYQQMAELQEKLEAIRTILDGGKAATQSSTPHVDGTLVEKWIHKLGASSDSVRILRFLADKAGLKYTRSQVTVAMRMSAKGGAFRGYIYHLKRRIICLSKKMAY